MNNYGMEDGLEVEIDDKELLELMSNLDDENYEVGMMIALFYKAHTMGRLDAPGMISAISRSSRLLLTGKLNVDAGDSNYSMTMELQDDKAIYTDKT